jgi:mevalonate kinase
MASFAPGSVKLFGEHAVIYGRVGLSAAFGKHASVSIVPSKSGGIEISLPDLGIERSVDEAGMGAEFEDVSSAVSRGDLKWLARMREGNLALPFSFMLGSVFLRSGFTPLRVSVRSEIPKFSGLASSSAIFSAFASELNAFLSLGLSADGLVDLANKGDVVVHGRPSGIDANTCVRGGFVRFRKGEQVKALGVKERISAVVCNTLVQKDSGKIIAKVADMAQADAPGVDALFDDVQEACFAGMDALAGNDLVKLGAEFDRAQRFFDAAGLSTREVAEIISFAKKNKAYGAKITGAGGGGCVLVLSPSPAKLAAALTEKGFPAFEAQLGVEGVRHNGTF